MNFGFNEEQELLRNTARKFFENECGSDTVRRLMETAEGISPELWKKLAEQGWLGLIYPDQYDGMGLGLVDLVVLMEEMGRAVAPGPYFSTVLLGGLAILEAGREAQKKEWLPKIAAGDRRVALAGWSRARSWARPGSRWPRRTGTVATPCPAPSSSCTTPTPPTPSWWRRARGPVREPTASRSSSCRRGPRG
jgi:hypothetical protein